MNSPVVQFFEGAMANVNSPVAQFFEGATAHYPQELLVGAYTARPTKDPVHPDENSELEVKFSNLHVEMSGVNV